MEVQDQETENMIHEQQQQQQQQLSHCRYIRLGAKTLRLTQDTEDTNSEASTDHMDNLNDQEASDGDDDDDVEDETEDEEVKRNCYGKKSYTTSSCDEDEDDDDDDDDDDDEENGDEESKSDSSSRGSSFVEGGNKQEEEYQGNVHKAWDEDDGDETSTISTCPDSNMLNNDERLDYCKRVEPQPQKFSFDLSDCEPGITVCRPKPILFKNLEEYNRRRYHDDGHDNNESCYSSSDEEADDEVEIDDDILEEEEHTFTYHDEEIGVEVDINDDTVSVETQLQCCDNMDESVSSYSTDSCEAVEGSDIDGEEKVEEEVSAARESASSNDNIDDDDDDDDDDDQGGDTSQLEDFDSMDENDAVNESSDFIQMNQEEYEIGDESEWDQVIDDGNVIKSVNEFIDNIVATCSESTTTESDASSIISQEIETIIEASKTSNTEDIGSGVMEQCDLVAVNTGDASHIHLASRKRNRDEEYDQGEACGGKEKRLCLQDSMLHQTLMMPELQDRREISNDATSGLLSDDSNASLALTDYSVDVATQLADELNCCVSPDAYITSNPIPLLTPAASPIPMKSDESVAEICEWPCNLVVDNALTSAIQLRALSPSSLAKLEGKDSFNAQLSEIVFPAKRFRSVTRDFSSPSM